MLDFAELQLDAAEQLLVVGDVRFPERIEIFACGGVDNVLAALRGISADIFVIIETSGCSQDEQSGLGIFDGDRVVAHPHFFAFGDNTQARLEFETAFFDLSEQSQQILAAQGGARRFMWAVDLGCEV